MIYHYTSIETLEKILASKKIRFNNLNDVDDKRESELFLKKSLAQFIFVSCWTKESKENIPLWELYTAGNGVRIGLPDYPWRKIDCTKWELPKGFNVVLSPNERYISPFDFKDIFGDHHIIMMPYAKPLPNTCFEKEVIYLPLKDLKNKYEEVYKITKEGDRFEISIKPLEFGLYKIDDWDFQKEYRFVLWIFPITKKIDFSDIHFYESIVQDMYRHIELEIPSPMKDFYLPIEPSIFEKMQIMAGPRCTSGDIQRIENILKENHIDIKIAKSGVRIR